MNGYARLFAGLGLGLALLVGLMAGMDMRGSIDRVAHILDLLRGGGVYSCIAFILVQAVVATVGILPASLIGVAAGLTYGLWGGFLLAAAGTLLGGWVAFMLSRSMLRPWIAALLNRSGRISRFDRAVGAGNWHFVCLMRISPIMPFSLTSYALGLTRIDQKSYMLGTLASLPALLAYVATGAFAHSGLEALTGERSILRLIPIAIGIVATVAATLYLRRLMIRTMGDADTQVSPTA
ncbi:MAG: TVP38/TMEM64 family protein [Sphingobium sp.]